MLNTFLIRNVCLSVCVSVICISLKQLVRWISNLAGVLLRARVSALPSLTFQLFIIETTMLAVFVFYFVALVVNWIL